MSKATAIDIDKVAREAAKPEFQYMDPSELPGIPVFWSLIVEPRPPKERVGMFYVPEDSRKADQIQCTVGRILAMGSLCLQAKTTGGLDLAKEVVRLQVGDEVLFQRHSGQRVNILRASGEERTIIAMSDSEILWKVTDNSRIRFFL